MIRQQRKARNKKALAARVGPPAVQEILADAVRHHQAGRFLEAKALYRQILQVDPQHADGLHLLGVVFHQAGRHQQAADLIGRAIAQDSKRAEFHYNLGTTLAALGWLSEAATCFRTAIALQADHPAAYSNLGRLLTMLGQPEAGIACFRKVVEISPSQSDGHYNLGNALARQWRLDEAVCSLRRAIAIEPNADAYNTIGNLLRDVGRVEESLTEYDNALRCTPDNFALRSNRILVENYCVDRSPDVMRDLARSFGVLASSQAQRPFDNWHNVPTKGPLRIGLVSHDLHNHPVGYFLEGLLSQADPDKIAFLAFPTQRYEDDLTARIRPRFIAWKPIAGMTDKAAAQLIRTQGVHVLLDLSGHTAGNRLPMFAWRPAPIQATWLGYFATTGLTEIDYIIADANVLPPERPTPFTEMPCLLPELYYCFSPPAEATEVSPLPARSSGFLTFGCFNTLAKINDALVALWARLLHAVSGSRLMLKAAPLQESQVRSAIRTRFAACGISEERLLLEGPSTRSDYLRAYHRIDVALDPYPFPGGATTFEALWMGVPVLTRKGDRFLSRVGETIMRNAGLVDWLAADEQDYLNRAARLVSDLGSLSRLREGLREQVFSSPLYDAERFARHFEVALSSMWDHWKTSSTPSRRWS